MDLADCVLINHSACYIFTPHSQSGGYFRVTNVHGTLIQHNSLSTVTGIKQVHLRPILYFDKRLFKYQPTGLSSVCV